MRTTFNIVILLLFIAQCHAFAFDGTKESKIAGYLSPRGAYGTYGNPPRLDNGQVDFKRLLFELKDIHADTYHWLIHEKFTDWDDLKQFLPMARKAKIKVWVCLVPPSESKPIARLSSEPFGLDYERWAVEIAKLSMAEPNLVVWSIDDFVHNLKFYTPEYLKKILGAAHAINPKLAFIPCCYYKQTTPAFVSEYLPLLDGVLFPYRAESDKANLKDATKVESEIAALRKLFNNPDFPIYLDIYATAHSKLGATTPEYVKDVLTAGMKSADGVLIYRHQDPVKNAEKYQIVKKGFKHKPKK